MKDFRMTNLLESDWMTLLRWLMKWSCDLPLLDGVWNNHVVCILIEIMQTDTDALLHSIDPDKIDSLTTSLMENWNKRLKEQSLLLKTLPACSNLQKKLQLNLFMKDKNQNIQTIKEIQEDAQIYWDEIANCGSIDPGFAVLMTFVQRYGKLIQPFNERWKEYPDLYFKQILKTIPHPALPDKVRLQLIKDPATDSLIIPPGTQFIAGEKEDGTFKYYRNQEAEHLTNMEPGTIIFTDSPEGAAGWRIESPLLLLQEGERSVTIHMRLTPASSIYLKELGGKSLAQLFVVQMDGDGEWIELPCSYVFNADKEELLIMFLLTEDSPLVKPVLQILARPAYYRQASQTGRQIIVKELSLRVKVKGIKTFSAYNTLGEVDMQSPFAPFGPQPMPGNWVMFGNKELEGKYIRKIDLDWMWSLLPTDEEGMKGHYREYGENISNDSFQATIWWRKNKTWHPCEGLFKLFDTVAGSDRLQGNKHLCFRPDDVLSEGYFRLNFEQPAIGFGHQAYRSLFPAVMLHNAQNKKRPHPLPKEPASPLIDMFHLSYEAEDTIFPAAAQKGKGHRFYKIVPLPQSALSPVEEEPVISLIQSFPGNMQLLIGILNGAGQERLKLYFEITPTSVLKEENMPILHWFYNNGTQWKPIAPERIPTDTIAGLTRNGEVELILPETIIPEWADEEGRVWLWASISDPAGQCGQIQAILFNTLEAIAEGGDGKSIPAGTITQMKEPVPGILEIRQPYPGFGGQEAEPIAGHSERICHRITHRNRPVLPADYEMIIRDEFPDIEKAVCMPANHSQHPVPIVQVLVIAHWGQHELPLCPDKLLEEIRASLQRRISPFVRLEINNPDYVPLTVCCSLRLKELASAEETRTRLQRKINTYIAPWLKKKLMPTFNYPISLKGLYTILGNDESIEQLFSLSVGYTDKTGKKPAEEKIFTYRREDKNEQSILPPSPSVIFIPATTHQIDMAGEEDGIDHLSIGGTFIIQ